jgi:hypothetical protein
MLQLEEKNVYLVTFYEHQLGEVLILDEAVDILVKDKKITSQTITTKKQLAKLNLGSE